MKWLWNTLKAVGTFLAGLALYLLATKGKRHEEYEEAAENKAENARQAKQAAQDREKHENAAQDAQERAEARVEALNEDSEEVDDPASYYDERRRVRDD